MPLAWGFKRGRLWAVLGQCQLCLKALCFAAGEHGYALGRQVEGVSKMVHLVEGKGEGSLCYVEVTSKCWEV